MRKLGPREAKRLAQGHSARAVDKGPGSQVSCPCCLPACFPFRVFPEPVLDCAGLCVLVGLLFLFLASPTCDCPAHACILFTLSVFASHPTEQLLTVEQSRPPPGRPQSRGGGRGSPLLSPARVCTTSTAVQRCLSEGSLGVRA